MCVGRGWRLLYGVGGSDKPGEVVGGPPPLLKENFRVLGYYCREYGGLCLQRACHLVD